MTRQAQEPVGHCFLCIQNSLCNRVFCIQYYNSSVLCGFGLHKIALSVPVSAAHKGVGLIAQSDGKQLGLRHSKGLHKQVLYSLGALVGQTYAACLSTGRSRRAAADTTAELNIDGLAKMPLQAI